MILGLGATGLTARADKTGTIAIAPAQPHGSWGCSLEPDESASLTINVAPGGAANGVNYILKSGPEFSLDSTSPDFIWTGGGSSYWIANTTWISAAPS